MYTSKIGSAQFEKAARQLATVLSRYSNVKEVKCEKCTSFDIFNRDSYNMQVSLDHCSEVFNFYVNDETCTCDDYDRGMDVNLVDEYGNIEKSFGLSCDCPGIAALHIMRYFSKNHII